MRALILASLCAAVQDGEAAARALLEEAAAALRKAPAVEFDVQVWTTGSEEPRKAKARLKRPGRGRLEHLIEQDVDSIHILDGKVSWMVRPLMRYFVDEPQVPGCELEWEIGLLPSIYLSNDLSLVLQGAQQLSVRKEKLSGADCDVVSWDGLDGRYEVWIDAKKQVRRSVWKFGDASEQAEQRADYGAIAMNAGPADALLSYKPPAEMKRMAEPDLGVLKKGTAAPDFEAKAMDGSPVKLSDFKGKPVVLLFWTHG